MSNLEDYVVVLNTLIEEQKRLLGKLAIDKAKKVNGISFDDNGMVISISIDPQDALSLMMEVYKDVVGQAANDPTKS